MTVTIRYRGGSDRRIITSAEFAAAGLGATTATWEKANGFEIDFDDVTGAWLLSQGDFETGSPNQTFGGLLQGALKVLIHNWKTEGWTPWTKQIISQDGAGLTTPTVVTDVLKDMPRGRITGQAGNVGGNQRDVYLRHNTNWEDSRIKSLWWGGSVMSSDADKATPQMGHIHRGKDIGGGVFRGYVVSNNIFGSLADRINQNVWSTTAGVLTLGTNGGAYSAPNLDRVLQVLTARRFDFLGTFINEFKVVPTDAYGARTGDLMTVANMTDTTYHATDTATSSVDRIKGIIQQVEPTTLSVDAEALDNGTITPMPHRRHWPYWVVSELRGTQLRVKAWRYEDEEPDWGDSLAVKLFDTSVAAPDQANATYTPQGGVVTPALSAAPTGAGLCGVVAAHMKNSAYMEYGHIEFEQL